MKREILRTSKAMALPFAVALAVSLSVGGTTASHADAKSMLNPMNWFNASQPQSTVQPSDDVVSEARRKAEEAQQAASQALQDAQKAMEKAAEARRQAEALDKSTKTQKKHLVVTPPAQTQTEAQSATPSEVKTDRVYQAPEPADTQKFEAKTTEKTVATSGKHEAWNPMTWFHKEDEDQTTGLDGSLTNSKADKDTPEAEAPKQNLNTDKTEAASTQTHSGWNLKTLFTKPGATDTEQASSEATAKTVEKAETKTDKAADEQNTASTQGKSGGWNMLNILSHPGQKAEAPAAKEAEKTAQPEAAETDQAVKTKAALVETEKGNIAFELFPDQAPLTVANFVKLVNDGFYNRYNMKFHRVVPGFVVQTGDPTGTGAGGSKERVPLEAKNKLSHNTKGVVAMARGADPNSATSQFYITLAPQPSLDGKYAVFGRVISGMDVLNKIEKDDMVYGIRMVDLSSVVRDPQPDKKNFFSFMK